ncbi:MAG: hypothetical protein ACK50A_02795 [Sphingobacteriaceae bacterium]|jgi:hypothetical protein
MKTTGKISLAGILLMSLLMISQNSYAGVGNLFTKFINDDANSINGVYIILGVLFAGLVAKVLQLLFLREEKPIHRIKVEHIHHRQRIIKKTS